MRPAWLTQIRDIVVAWEADTGCEFERLCRSQIYRGWMLHLRHYPGPTEPTVCYCGYIPPGYAPLTDAIESVAADATIEICSITRTRPADGDRLVVWHRPYSVKGPCDMAQVSLRTPETRQAVL